MWLHTEVGDTAAVRSCRHLFGARKTVHVGGVQIWLHTEVGNAAAVRSCRRPFGARNKVLVGGVQIRGQAAEAGNAYRLVDVQVPTAEEAKGGAIFTFSLRKEKLRAARRTEGHYLLRSNLTGEDPAVLWQRYIQLTEIEAVFRNLKSDLALRPIHHQKDSRVEAHIFVAFLAYCLYVTLQQRLRALAPGLTSRAVIEKMTAIQMVDVHLPTTDGRLLILPRYTQPETGHQLLLKRLHLVLPDQPPPRISMDNEILPAGASAM